MNRYRKFLLMGCCVMAMLSGCGDPGENPYRVDTVVYIPVDPAETPTEPAPAEETQAPAEPEETEGESASTGNKTSSGSKSSSSGSSSGNKNFSGTKATQPQETQPPVTQPPATQPPETEAPLYDPSDYEVGSLEYAVLDAVNAYRIGAGAAALSLDSGLSGIAALRAREVKQVWSHSRPDGRDFATALSDYGYGYAMAAENLVYANDPDAQAMVDKWMSSDSNSGSLLNGSFTTAGIGVYQSGDVTYLAVILVG